MEVLNCFKDCKWFLFSIGVVNFRLLEGIAVLTYYVSVFSAERFWEFLIQGCTCRVVEGVGILLKTQSKIWHA